MMTEQTLEIEVDAFLEHYGSKGMKWGVRKSKSQRATDARKKGLGPGQLRKEAKSVKEAGGGLKGTIKARREKIKSGDLSKSDARKGTTKFGASVVGAMLVGGTAGHVIGKVLVKNIK